MQLFRAEQMKASAGLATRLSSLCHTRERVCCGKLSPRPWKAYCSVCRGSVSSWFGKSANSNLSVVTRPGRAATMIASCETASNSGYA